MNVINEPTVEGPVPEAGPQPASSGNGVDLLSLEVKSEFKSVMRLAMEWDRAVERLGGPIYMTLDWLRTWWEFYGGGCKLRVLLFRNGGDLVAIIPLYLQEFGFGPLRTRVARLVGANIPPKAFDPPVDKESAGEVVRRLMQQVFDVDHCDLLSFGPVSQSWSRTTAFRQCCLEQTKYVGSVKHACADVQTVFPLPDSFAGYLETLSKADRKNRMKRLRKLERNYRVRSDIVSHPDLVEGEFEAFVRQHREQWQSAGKGGHFEAWPEGEAYNRCLIKRMAENGRVRFFRLLVDDQVVANRYTYQLGKNLFSELPARAVGAPWDNLGIGSTSLIKFNQAAIAAGIRKVDSGLGAYEHKARVGGIEIPVGRWRVTGSARSGRWKTRMFLLMTGLVKLIVHKIYYRRILRCLPKGITRSQPRISLRFDV